MVVLLTAVVALLVGPLIVAPLERQRHMRDMLDGFIFVSIGGLVAIDILPHLVEELGALGLLLVAVGLWGPSWLEHRFREAARSTHVAVAVFAAFGVLVHTLIDGAALEATGKTSLVLAVLLHRLPVGMAVWWLLRPAWGTRGALAMLAAMVTATALGFLLGHEVLVDIPELAILEALVAGSILHVVFNRLHLNPELETQPLSPRSEGLGNLLGLGFLCVAFGLVLPPSGNLQQLLQTILELTLVAAPALILGYTLAGVLGGMVPLRSLAWIGKGGYAKQSLNGMLVGLPLPVCSCGVVPLYRSLVQRGVPPSAGLAFLIATPELGLDALIVSWPLLGWEMTVARLLAAGVIAWVVGWALGRMMPVAASVQKTGCGHCHSDPLDDAAEASWSWQGLRRGLGFGYGELFDSTMPWLVVGLVVAALAAPFLKLVPGLELPGAVEVAVFALIGMPVYVCATGSTPIVAMMLISGVSPGAALAFLVTGPATNPATFGVLRQLHGGPAALRFGVLTAGLAIAAGVLLNAVPGFSVSPARVGMEHVHWWHWLSLAALLLMLVAAIWRRGARALVAELTLSAHE